MTTLHPKLPETVLDCLEYTKYVDFTPPGNYVNSNYEFDPTMHINKWVEIGEKDASSCQLWQIEYVSKGAPAFPDIRIKLPVGFDPNDKFEQASNTKKHITWQKSTSNDEPNIWFISLHNIEGGSRKSRKNKSRKTRKNKSRKSRKNIRTKTKNSQKN